jgi:hypothetical protein
VGDGPWVMGVVVVSPTVSDPVSLDVPLLWIQKV